MNTKLKKNIKAILTAEIKRSARSEAFQILSKSDEETIGKFLYQFHSDSYNGLCMMLDAAKDVLVKSKQMKQRKGDSFGYDPNWYKLYL